MNLYLKRYASGEDDTLGLFFIEDEFVAYTLEDEFRAVKVLHETRIPAGSYEIKFRTVGGFHNRYSAKFGGIHQGMLHLQDVPDFEYILIHCGNSDKDTSGCILLGDTAQQNITEKGFIGASVSAYKRVYPRIANALMDNQKVFIHISDKI